MSEGDFDLFDLNTWSLDGALNAAQEGISDYLFDAEGNVNWKNVGKLGAGAVSLYKVFDELRAAKAAGNAAEEALALQKLMATTQQDLALAEFDLQRKAYHDSLAIELQKMGYWKAAQQINYDITKTQADWYKKLQPFALDREKYDKALRENNLKVLEEQTAHISDVLRSNTSDIQSIYEDQSDLYTDQVEALDDYETKLLNQIDQLGQRDAITNESLMADYNNLYDQNMGELNDLIDRVNSRGYSGNYDNGMSASTVEDDRSRDLTKKYFNEVLKAKDNAASQAVTRATQKDNAITGNRNAILNEITNNSNHLQNAFNQAVGTGNHLFSNANSIAGRDYDLFDAMTSLKNGAMTAAGTPATGSMNTSSGNLPTYSGSGSSLLNNASSTYGDHVTTYSTAAQGNTKSAHEGAADILDLMMKEGE
jgi:hypothetical protein